MADYHSVLTSAIAKLDNNSETARRALYDRARQAVFNRMRVMEPPVSEEDIGIELAALNAAIARIEDDIARPVEAAFHTPRRPARPRAPATPGRAAATLAPLAVAAPAGDAPEVEPRAGPGAADRMRKRALPGPVRAGVVVVALLIIAAVGYAYWQRQAARPSPDASASQRQAPAAPLALAPGTRPAEERRASVEASDATIPYILRRQLVYYRTTYPAGTVIIIKPQHALYLVNENAAALRYAIGVGADCDDTAGMLTVARKEGGPEPSVQAASAAADQPSARDGHSATVPTLILGDSKCRIRATNVASTIGRDQSSGGFQLITDDMLDLYDRIPVGTKIVVMN